MPIAFAALSVLRAEQAQGHQRLRHARFDGDEDREQQRRAAEKAERPRRSPAGVIGADDRVDGEHQRGGDGDRAAEVEPRPLRRRAGARQHAEAEADHRDADRQVDEEDPVPVVDVGEDAAEQHADAAASGADEAVHAHRLGALGRLGEQVHQQRQGDRVDDRAADPLHGAGDDQRHLRRRQPAGERGGGEENDADDEHAPMAV